MKPCQSPILLASAAALAALLCGSSPNAAAQENKAPPLPEASPGHPRSPQKMTRESRAAFLTTLYDQLKQAPSEEAAELVVKAIEKVWRQSGSDTADLLMERAALAIQAKNLPLAMELLSALVQVAPEYAEAWNQLATVHFMQDDYRKAMQGLRQVLTLEPRHFKAIEGLALILRELGDKKGALRAVRRALAIHPQLKSAKQAEDELMRDVEGQGI
jgi:tetratricopeptide (TPR) repeat protein